MITGDKMIATCDKGHSFEFTAGNLTNFNCPVCGRTTLRIMPKVIMKAMSSPPENKVVAESQIEKKGEPQGLTLQSGLPKKGGRLRL
jgi:hypothetical protein